MDTAPRLIVLHCTATPDGRWHTVEDIDAWHAQRGFRRAAPALRAFNPTLRAIGYHWVIYLNGAVVAGRRLGEPGAHAAGFNHGIGLCLVGTRAYTPRQWAALADQLRWLATKTGIPLQHATAANGWRGVCGHRDLPGVAKACHGFPVDRWLAGDLAPLAGHLAPHWTGPAA